MGWNENKDETKSSDEMEQMEQMEQALTHKNLACTHLLNFLGLFEGIY